MVYLKYLRLPLLLVLLAILFYFVGVIPQARSLGNGLVEVWVPVRWVVKALGQKRQKQGGLVVLKDPQRPSWSSPDGQSRVTLRVASRPLYNQVVEEFAKVQDDPTESGLTSLVETNFALLTRHGLFEDERRDLQNQLNELQAAVRKTGRWPPNTSAVLEDGKNLFRDLAQREESLDEEFLAGWLFSRKALVTSRKTTSRDGAPGRLFFTPGSSRVEAVFLRPEHFLIFHYESRANSWWPDAQAFLSRQSLKVNLEAPAAPPWWVKAFERVAPYLPKSSLFSFITGSRYFGWIVLYLLGTVPPSLIGADIACRRAEEKGEFGREEMQTVAKAVGGTFCIFSIMAALLMVMAGQFFYLFIMAVPCFIVCMVGFAGGGAAGMVAGRLYQKSKFFALSAAVVVALLAPVTFLLASLLATPTVAGRRYPGDPEL